MVVVRIKFVADQILFQESLKEVDEETKAITDAISEETDDLVQDQENRLVNIQQNLLVSDIQARSQETDLERNIRQIQENIVLLEGMDTRTEADKNAIMILEERLKVLQQEDIKIDSQLAAAETKTNLLKIEIQTLLTVISGALGFVALGSALAGEQILGQFTPLISIAVLTLQQVVQLQALGAISGNLALFAAAGALAASAAATIGTIKSFQAQTQAQFDSDQRRKLNLGEDF